MVINGDGGQHGKGREYREYLGKGKMYEEQETKWVKVPEKGNARYHSNRTRYRGSEDGSRFRSSRSDRSRGYTADERTWPSRGCGVDQAHERGLERRLGRRARFNRRSREALRELI